MALVDFTTFDDIRAVLGVSGDELEDATLSLAVYEYNLTLELEDISLDLPARYATAAQKDLASQSAVEQRFVQATRLFATYAVAKQLLASLPLFSPKEISDGKASMVRYSVNPYETTIKRVEAQYERFRQRLSDVFGTLTASTRTSVSRPYMSAVTPGRDPVTGS